MKAENLFAPGDRFYVASVRGTHFTVISVEENEIELVDQNRNNWDAEVGETIAFYTPGAGPVKTVHHTEVHFK